MTVQVSTRCPTDLCSTGRTLSAFGAIVTGKVCVEGGGFLRLPEGETVLGAGAMSRDVSCSTTEATGMVLVMGASGCSGLGRRSSGTVLTAPVTGDGASGWRRAGGSPGLGGVCCWAFSRWSASTASRNSRLEGRDVFLSASRSWRLVGKGGRVSSATNQTTSHSFNPLRTRQGASLLGCRPLQ